MSTRTGDRQPLRSPRSFRAALASLLALTLLLALTCAFPTQVFADDPPAEKSREARWKEELLRRGSSHDMTRVFEEIVAAGEGDVARVNELLEQHVVSLFDYDPAKPADPSSPAPLFVEAKDWDRRLGSLLAWLIKRGFEHKDDPAYMPPSIRNGIVLALARDRQVKVATSDEETEATKEAPRPYYEATLGYLPADAWPWFLDVVRAPLRRQVPPAEQVAFEPIWRAHLWLISQVKGLQRLVSLETIQQAVAADSRAGSVATWDVEDALRDALADTLGRRLFKNSKDFSAFLDAKRSSTLNRILQLPPAEQGDAAVEFLLELDREVDVSRQREARQEAIKKITALSPEAGAAGLASFLSAEQQPAVRRAALEKARQMSPGLTKTWTDLLVKTLEKCRDRPTTEGVARVIGGSSFQPKDVEEKVFADQLAEALVTRLADGAEDDDPEVRVDMASALVVVGSKEHILAALAREQSRWIHRGGADAAYAQLIRAAGSLRGLPLGTLVLHAFKQEGQEPTEQIRRAVIDGLGNRLRDDPGNRGDALESVLRLFLKGGPRSVLAAALEEGEASFDLARLNDPIVAFPTALHARIFNALQYAREAETIELLREHVARAVERQQRAPAAERALGALVRRDGNVDAARALLTLIDPAKSTIDQAFTHDVLSMLGALPASVKAGPGDAEVRDEVLARVLSFIAEGVSAATQAVAVEAVIALRDPGALDIFLAQWQAAPEAPPEGEHPWIVRLRKLLLAITDPEAPKAASEGAAAWLRTQLGRQVTELPGLPGLVASLAIHVADQRKSNVLQQIAVDAQIELARSQPAEAAAETVKDGLRRVEVLIGSLGEQDKQAALSSKYDLLVLKVGLVPATDKTARRDAVLAALRFLVQSLANDKERATKALAEPTLYPSLRDLYVEGEGETRAAYTSRIDALRKQLQTIADKKTGS